MKRIKRGLKQTMGFILTAGLIVSPVLSVSAEESANVETGVLINLWYLHIHFNTV